MITSIEAKGALERERINHSATKDRLAFKGKNEGTLRLSVKMKSNDKDSLKLREITKVGLQDPRIKRMNSSQKDLPKTMKNWMNRFPDPCAEPKSFPYQLLPKTRESKTVSLPDSHGEKQFHSSSLNILVNGKQPDLRFDDQLYYRLKISDLTRRSLNGDCRAHGCYSNAHYFCGDRDETCLGCLAIAKEALRIYSEERILPSKLFRQKVPLCTCNVTTMFSTQKKIIEKNRSIAIYKLATKNRER